MGRPSRCAQTSCPAWPPRAHNYQRNPRSRAGARGRGVFPAQEEGAGLSAGKEGCRESCREGCQALAIGYDEAAAAAFKSFLFHTCATARLCHGSSPRLPREVAHASAKPPEAVPFRPIPCLSTMPSCHPCPCPCGSGLEPEEGCGGPIRRPTLSDYVPGVRLGRLALQGSSGAS